MSVLEELRDEIWRKLDEHWKVNESGQISHIMIHPHWFAKLAIECEKGELINKEAYNIEFMGIPILRDPKVEKWEIII